MFMQGVMRRAMFLVIAGIAVSTVPALAQSTGSSDSKNQANAPSSTSFVTVNYSTIKVDGLAIAYREAGDPASPKIVLLHGFPSSSHQYRNLLPALADKFHVIAPDYPGFGNSDMPDPATYSYTFDKLSE